MPHLYLTSLEWADDGDGFMWRSPSPSLTVGMIDARSNPECGDPGGSFPTRTLLSLSARDNNLDGYLGEFDRDSINTAISRTVIDAIEDRLRLNRGDITADNPADIIAQVLTELGDPTGQDRWKPLRSDVIHLGGFSPIWRGNFRNNPIWRQKWLASRQRSYREIRQAAQSGRLGSARTDVFVSDFQHHLRVLDYWSKRYRIDYRLLIPPDLPDEGVLPHRTSVSDDFNRANSDSMGADWDEVEGDTDISGNEAKQKASNETHCAHTTALSGDDHYSQIIHTGGDDFGGPMARYTGTTTRTYYFVGFNNAGDDLQLYKRENGTFIKIGNSAETRSFPDTYRVTCDGDQISADLNGTTVIGPVTDSAIDTNTTVGFRGHSAGQFDHTFDNFEAADLAAGGQTISPAPVARRMVVRTPSLAGSGVASVSPAPVGRAQVANAPSVSGSGTTTIAPPSLDYKQKILEPSLSGTGAGSISPAPVARRQVIQSPSLAGSGAASISPAPVTRSQVAVSPVIAAGGVSIAPSPIARRMVVQSPSLSGSGAASIAPAPVARRIVIAAPSIAGSGAASISPSPVARRAIVVSPSIAGTGAALITLVAVTRSMVVVAPVIAVVAPVTGTVALTLPSRDVSLTLVERDISLTLPSRDISLEAVER